MDKSIADNRELYMNEPTSDVILVMGTDKIPAHKSVLMGCSDYFDAMFNSEMIECNLNEVKVEESLSQQFVFVLRIAYGFTISAHELNDLSFNGLFDSLIISNKYHFKTVEHIISDLFLDKLIANPTDYLYVKRNTNLKAHSLLNKENIVNNNDLNIYELLDLSKSYNLSYFSDLCQDYIEKRAINTFKYYYNQWF